jgi:hypothetical protein
MLNQEPICITWTQVVEARLNCDTADYLKVLWTRVMNGTPHQHKHLGQNPIRHHQPVPQGCRWCGLVAQGRQRSGLTGNVESSSDVLPKSRHLRTSAETRDQNIMSGCRVPKHREAVRVTCSTCDEWTEIE